jgi:hypothetical protein
MGKPEPCPGRRGRPSTALPCRLARRQHVWTLEDGRSEATIRGPTATTDSDEGETPAGDESRDIL